jgi:hypothetical protein
MSEQTATAFPKDLLDARRELHQVHASLNALPKGKPWSLGPSDGWDDTDTGRWYPSLRPPTDGWAETDVIARETLQARARELSQFVITHKFWQPLTRPDLVEARTKLIQVSAPTPAEPTT